jgi:hypothetical protein
MAKDLTNQVEVNKSLLKVFSELNDDSIVVDTAKTIVKVRVANMMLRNSVEQSRYDTKMGYSKKVDYFETY